MPMMAITTNNSISVNPGRFKTSLLSSTVIRKLSQLSEPVQFKWPIKRIGGVCLTEIRPFDPDLGIGARWLRAGRAEARPSDGQNDPTATAGNDRDPSAPLRCAQDNRQGSGREGIPVAIRRLIP
jgi:hypothetical protein